MTSGTLEQTGKKSPVLAEASSPLIPAPQAAIESHDGRSITVHQFLQDITKKPFRKYGRRNRLVAVELDVHRSEDSSPSPISCSDNSQRDQNAATRLKHTSRRRVPLRRHKHFAKPLAQRLFEADVFSTGAFSQQPTTQDPTHISTRRPLQFITSLNLTPSLETRIYQRRQVVAGGSSSTRTLAVSNFSGATSLVPNRALDRNTRVMQVSRIGDSPGAFLSAGKRVLRARGQKRGLARSSNGPGPFQFVPLPLMRVKTYQEAVPPQDPVIRSRLAHIQNAKSTQPLAP